MTIQDEVLVSLSSGDFAVLNKNTGNYRLYTQVNPFSDDYRWDGIITRPFRPQLIQGSLFSPSLVRQTTELLLYDFDCIVQTEVNEVSDDSNQIEDFVPKKYSIPCSEEVFGCCYSEELQRLIVSCGNNTLDHQLRVYPFC